MSHIAVSQQNNVILFNLDHPMYKVYSSCILDKSNAPGNDIFFLPRSQGYLVPAVGNEWVHTVPLGGYGDRLSLSDQGPYLFHHRGGVLYFDSSCWHIQAHMKSAAKIHIICDILSTQVSQVITYYGPEGWNKAEKMLKLRTLLVNG